MKFVYRNPNTDYNYFTNDDGSTVYRRTQDGHGGHGFEHRAEMEQIAARIAEQKIAEALPEIRKGCYVEAYNDLINAMEFDVTSAVRVGFENAGSIFYDSKTQKVIADAFMHELKKRLKDMN